MEGKRVYTNNLSDLSYTHVITTGLHERRLEKADTGETQRLVAGVDILKIQTLLGVRLGHAGGHRVRFVDVLVERMEATCSVLFSSSNSIRIDAVDFDNWRTLRQVCGDDNLKYG